MSEEESDGDKNDFLANRQFCNLFLINFNRSIFFPSHETNNKTRPIRIEEESGGSQHHPWENSNIENIFIRTVEEDRCGNSEPSELFE